MVFRTKRAALLFVGMFGDAAEARVFAAGCQVLKDMSFVGIVSDRRGCMMVLQRGGKDIQLLSLRTKLAKKLDIVITQILVVSPPTAKDALTNVVWSLTEGTLRLAGKSKRSQADIDQMNSQGVVPFDPSPIPTAESPSTQDKVSIGDHFNNSAHQCTEDCPAKSYSMDYTLIENEEV